jgi:hypothetical protein
LFILTAHSDKAVLPTIASRAEKISIVPVSLKNTLGHFDGYDAKTVQSAWQLSGGSAGLLTALLIQDSEHPLKLSVEAAKKILSQSRYERILTLDQMSTDKGQFVYFLDALSRVLAALQRAVAKNGGTNARKLIKARQQVDSALRSLETNASPKLIALNLAQQLSI